jgi:ribosome-associated protein
MDDDLVVQAGVVIPAHELQWRFSRAGGPGGQGVNTTDSRVQVSFDVVRSPSIPDALRARALRRLGSRLHDGRVTVTAMESRSQWQNRRAALARLAHLLEAALADPTRPRRPTRPSRASVDRRIADKKARGQVKRLRSANPGD